MKYLNFEIQIRQVFCKNSGTVYCRFFWMVMLWFIQSISQYNLVIQWTFSYVSHSWDDKHFFLSFLLLPLFMPTLFFCSPLDQSCTPVSDDHFPSSLTCVSPLWIALSFNKLTFWLLPLLVVMTLEFWCIQYSILFHSVKGEI